MLEFFMSKPAKQLYWIRKGNMEKLKACYRNEGLLPKTEEALLEPMNRGVLLEFLKWGRFKEVANELRLIVLHIERPKEIEAYFRSAKSPKTEEALLKPKNRAVLLKFLKWGKLEDVAHIMELYLTRYRGEFIRNRRQGVSFDEDNLLMLIALCREYPAFLLEYVRPQIMAVWNCMQAMSDLVCKRYCLNPSLVYLRILCRIMCENMAS